jgi:hypothetical protein
LFSLQFDQATFLLIPALPRAQKGDDMKRISKGVAMLLVIVCAALACAAQDKLRRIEQPAKFVYKNTPLQVAFRMDGKELPNRELQAGPDWLRRLSLDVSNVSGKDISSLRIDLILKESGDAVPVVTVITVDLAYSEPNIKVLPAGETVTLKPPDRLVDWAVKLAREQGLEDIEKVVLDIRQVGFTDDTGWAFGYPTRKDPGSGRSVFVTERPRPPVLDLPANILIPGTLDFFLT